MILAQYTDMSGKIRIQWQSQATLNVYLYKFTRAPSEQQLQALSAASDAESELQQIQPVRLEIQVERATLLGFLEKVKATPNITLTQYNAYLATLSWSESAVIRYFVYMVAKELAERRDLVLSNANEITALAAVRDFIVDTPIRKLARLIFNNNA